MNTALETELPPNDLLAEQGFLGSVMLSPEDAIPEAVQLVKTDAFFYDERNRIVWNAILKVWDNRNPVHVVSIRNAILSSEDRARNDFPDSLAYLSSLEDKTPSSSNLRYFFNILLERYQARQMIKVAQRAIDQAYAKDFNVSKLEEFEMSALEIRKSTDHGSGNSDIRALCSELTADYQFAFENKGSRLPVIKTGLACWDKMMTLRPGYHLIGARPSVGKTSLLMQILRQAANDGFTAGMVSLETMAKNLVHRSIASEAGVDGRTLSDGTIKPVDFSKIVTATQRLCKNSNRMLIRVEYGLTADRFQAICRQLYQQGARIIGLDFFGRIIGKGKTAYEQATYASHAIKDISLELQIPIIVLAQLLRDFDKGDREPRLSDLKSTGSLEEDAETVTLLSCKEEDAHRALRPVKGKVAKNKDEPTGSFDLTLIAPQFRFEEAPPQSKINPTDY